ADLEHHGSPLAPLQLSSAAKGNHYIECLQRRERATEEPGMPTTAFQTSCGQLLSSKPSCHRVRNLPIDNIQVETTGRVGRRNEIAHVALKHVVGPSITFCFAHITGTLKQIGDSHGSPPYVVATFEAVR